MVNRDIKPMAFVMVGLSLSYILACSRSTNDRSSGVQPSSIAPATDATTTQNAQAQKPEAQKPEPKRPEAKSVEPQVQSEIEGMEAQKRVSLLADAVIALDATRTALTALDKGDKHAALAALERASGKLDLVISRDPKLAFAPVEVSTTMVDLYANPDTVKAVVKDVKDDLANNRVQQARHVMTDLASEADTHVTELPLGTYPAAIKAAAPLIDAGKIDEAKAELGNTINTLVTVTYIVPLPRIRAQAMLDVAGDLAAKKNRNQADNQKVHNLIDGARTQIQLAETLGYGTKENYKALYAQLDDLQKHAENGQSGKGLFARMKESLRNFKFSA